MNNIHVSSGAVVKISKSNNETNFLLHGRPEGLERAAYLIKRNLQASTSITFDIPWTTRRLVVGPKGSIVKSIKQKHQVEINIERRRLCRRFNLCEYHDDDPEAMLKQYTWINYDEYHCYTPTVKVKVTGNQRDCLAARDLILDFTRQQAEELCQFPHNLYAYDAIHMVREYFDKKLIRLTLKEDPDNSSTLIVQGHVDLVRDAMKLTSRFTGLFCDTITIPPAFATIHMGFENVSTHVLQTSDTEAKITIMGQRSDVISARENFLDTIGSTHTQRLMLTELHQGNLEHVRNLLSLDRMEDLFLGLRIYLDVEVQDPSVYTHDTVYIDVFGYTEESTKQAIERLSSIIESVKPSDVYSCSDKDLVFKAKLEKTVCPEEVVCRCEEEWKNK